MYRQASVLALFSNDDDDDNNNNNNNNNNDNNNRNNNKTYIAPISILATFTSAQKRINYKKLLRLLKFYKVSKTYYKRVYKTDRIIQR